MNDSWLSYILFVAAISVMALLGACDNDAVTSARVVIPIDTVTVTVVERDTVVVRTADTVRLTDTVVVYDTTVVVDTVSVAIRDSLLFALDGHIRDDANQTLALGTFTAPAFSAVWAEIELSGNDQKDEAWGLRADGVEVVQGACPVVPDHPWIDDEGWVFVGYVPAGTFALEARHAILYSCYPPTAGFAGANSVHFERLKLVFYQ